MGVGWHYRSQVFIFVTPMDVYSWAKALHLVSVVSWFAGLFYLVRLFVYHAEALEKPAAMRDILVPQFALMEKRLWHGITIPAMIGTTVFGLWLMDLIQAWNQPWFLVKLGFLIPLFLYHGICGRIRGQLLAGNCRWTSRHFRMWNEVATVLLFAIVFTAVFKRPLGAGYGLLAVAVLGALGMTVFLGVKKSRRP